ncbi:MAG: AAA family ATPase [Chloroflexota bacterium]|nr:AAA family ATPase [Chloroflexota bacterium]
MAADDLLTLKAAAEQYSVTYDRLRRAAWDGRLPTEGTGHARLVRPEHVETFLREGRVVPGREAPPPKRTAPPLGKIIAVALLKGGTGKTTSTLNLGVALGQRGYRVLLVDTDHQCSLTSAAGLNPAELAPEQTLFGAIQLWTTQLREDLHNVIQMSPAGVDIVPASIRLSLTERALHLQNRREYVLQSILAPVAPQYDVVLIDTQPASSNLVHNALVAAHEVIIPVEPEQLAVESLGLMLDQIDEVRRSRLNPHLKLCGVLVTQVDVRMTLHRDLLSEIREQFSSDLPVFNTVIRRSSKIAESQARHQSVLQYDPKGSGATAYRALAEEISREWE